MNDFTKIRFCDKCKIHYFINEENDIKKCSKCGQSLTDVGISKEEYFSLSKKKICSKCKKKYPKFMIRCPNCDWQLEKIDSNRQYNAAIKAEQKRVQEEIEKNTLRCPKCGSTAVSIGARGFSIITGFIGAGSTVNRCGKCGHKWTPYK